MGRGQIASCYKRMSAEDQRAAEGFLSAVKTLSELNNDPEFYNLGFVKK